MKQFAKSEMRHRDILQKTSGQALVFFKFPKMKIGGI